MNHAVMTEIDIEKKIKQLLRIQRITSYQLPLSPKIKNWYKAFDVSVEAHKAAKIRRAYIFHPIAVAKLSAQK
jgi:(p)ppGpp synthase/HD superfamily hydrolase